jgi:hypothetical protein
VEEKKVYAKSLALNNTLEGVESAIQKGLAAVRTSR